MKEGHVVLGMAALGILMVSAGAVQAVVVEIAFEAVVTHVDAGNGVLDGVVGIGDTFVGTYCYDTATPGSKPAPPPWNPDLMVYEYDTFPSGVTLTVSDFTAMTNPTNVRFDVVIGSIAAVHMGYDVFGWMSHDNIVAGVHGITVSEIFLSAGTNVMFGEHGPVDGDTTLPVGPLDLAKWDFISVVVTGTSVDGLDNWRIISDVTSMQSIPEPATVFLVIAGALLAHGRRSPTQPSTVASPSVNGARR